MSGENPMSRTVLMVKKNASLQILPQIFEENIQHFYIYICQGGTQKCFDAILLLFRKDFSSSQLTQGYLIVDSEGNAWSW
jgi:hypothetical protein